MAILFGAKAQELLDKVKSYKEDAEYSKKNLDRAREAQETAEEKAERRVERAKHEHELEVARVRSDYDIQLKTIVLDETKKRLDEVTSVTERAIKAEALVEGKDAVIAAQEQTFARLNEQMQFLCTLVPKIELDKLQFTVNQSANHDSSKA